MSRRVALALGLALMAAAPAIAATNLLYNGDFEVVSTATPPPGWAMWGNTTGQTASDYSRDTTVMHSGSGSYKIHHPANTSGYTVSSKTYAIQTHSGKGYTLTFWARTDNPGTAMFYWDCYSQISPTMIDAPSAGRLPFTVDGTWRQYSFTVNEGTDFFANSTRYMLVSFKPVGNDTAIARTLWVDDVVVTEQDALTEPLIDPSTLNYAPLNHRLSPGTSLVINADANNQIGPSTPQAAGASFHRVCGYGRHPYDPNMAYQFVGSLAPLQTALNQMNNPMTRFYAVGVEPFGLTGTIDKLAELCTWYNIPQEWCVIELEIQDGTSVLTADQWATAVSYSRSHGYGFKYWEISNEPYTRAATAFTSPDDYIAHLIAVSQAIRSADPTAKIIAATAPSMQSWGNYVLKKAAGCYDYVAGHWYDGTDPWANSPEFVTLTSNFRTLDQILQYNALITAYNPGVNISQMDTEWGLSASGPTSIAEPQRYWRTSNIVGALYRAVRMIYMARESMMHGASGWEMFCRATAPTFGYLSRDVPDKKMMLYWLYYYFHRHCGPVALNISGTAPWYTPPVVEHAQVDCGPLTPTMATLSADGSQMYFVIVNASWSGSQNCQINLSHFNAQTATAVVLSQSSADADPMVYDEASTITAVPVSLTGQQASLTLPAHSIVFITVNQPAANSTFVGAHIFYNGSAFDGYDSGASVGDDSAVATDKTPLASGIATFANYTSYVQGINGIMIDVSNLSRTPTAADFTFKVGNDANPNGWAAAPAPSVIAVRNGAGAQGSDRITLIWPNGSITNKWLQVTVKTSLGLTADQVFYFGNAIGETGNDPAVAQVTPTDAIAVRNAPHTLFANPSAIDDRCDFNRDARVSPTDAIIVRNNATTSETSLRLITVP